MEPPPPMWSLLLALNHLTAKPVHIQQQPTDKSRTARAQTHTEDSQHCKPCTPSKHAGYHSLPLIQQHAEKQDVCKTNIFCEIFPGQSASGTAGQKDDFHDMGMYSQDTQWQVIDKLSLQVQVAKDYGIPWRASDPGRKGRPLQGPAQTVQGRCCNPLCCSPRPGSPAQPIAHPQLLNPSGFLPVSLNNNRNPKYFASSSPLICVADPPKHSCTTMIFLKAQQQ